MITSAKEKFKRFETFYIEGELQPIFIQSIRNNFEAGFNGEVGVVDSWFKHCEDKYGKVEQPALAEASKPVASGAI